MLLLQRDPVAGTHSKLVLASALTHPDAAQCRMSKVAAVLPKMEMRRYGGRIIVASEPQVLIYPEGVYNFSRIHFPFGIPDALKFPEGIHEFGSEHLGQELGFRLAVAVLAR